MNILNQNLLLGLLSCALLPGIAAPVSAQTPAMYASVRQTDNIPYHKAGTMSLKDALVRLKKLQNIRFAYREGLLDGKMVPADLVDRAETMEAEAALKLLLSDFALGYMRVNKTQYSIYNSDANATILNYNSLFADKLKGKITGPDGVPVPGATISVKGKSSIATVANEKGEFELNLKDATLPVVLVVSSIGFDKQEITVSSATDLVGVSLVESNKALSEVVVTALGIKKDRKALAYAVTEVKGTDFTQAREVNIANALTGKVAGVNATSLASGPGGSSRVIIRGNTSLNGDNQPLYVVNGMPIDNTTPGGSPTTGGGGQNVDRGDGIGGINPDDIETISVLKGGTAAALYGSRAANGVIVITTKKGRARKGIGLDYNSTFTAETPAVYPEWQYEYGQGDGGVKPNSQSQAVTWGRRSWGAKMDGQNYIAFDGKEHPYSPQKNNIKNFYRTGATYTNTVAFSGGNESMNFRFSLANTNSKSIVPNSKFDRKIANLNLNAVLGKRLSIEAIAQYNVENATNRSSSGDATGNPNWGVYMIANTVDIRSLDPGYDANGREIQWNETAYASNPYFVVNRFKNNDTKNRFIGQASVKYDLMKNLYVKGNVSRDFFNYDYVGILPTGTVYTTNATGEYSGLRNAVSETNSMLTANYNTRLAGKIGLNVLAGGNARRYKSNSTLITGTQFIIPFFYSYTNLSTVTTTPARNNVATNSVFGAIDMDYKSILFLNFSARQDWFSTLSPQNNHIFYPAVGTSFILSDAVKLPKAISYAKLRTSWAQVGGATPDPYILNQSYTMVQGGHAGQPVQTVTQSGGANLVTNPNLKPLTATTFEAGVEAQFLNNRVGFDITYYSKQTTDDILSTAISTATGYNKALLNVGKLSNKGIEVLLTGTPVKSKNFTWNVSYNMAYNKSEVIQLAAGLTTLEKATSVGSWAFVHDAVGHPYGVIKGYSVAKNEKGETIYNSATGYEQKSALKYLGNGVPPLTMGFSNTFRYKRLSLDILVDGKFGNKVFSVMDVYATRFGLHKKTLAGRENGLALSGVDQNGNPYAKTIPVSNLRLYYDNTKNYTDQFMYDGSFVKLRQVVFSYQLPVQKLKIVESASLSFVARNLLTLYKQTDNFDPESSYTNGNAQGFEAFGIPRTRSFGLNLMAKF
ncbi:SusC/RagA family TonB-linked outer membrane protein [Chitinophaga sancti]|uniref:SusC/RagA family TonB-linked outer membrane protein n=1 Tax=Chitinophaga sancti TaxID=1004 RepID=A0A1K1QSL3_9BACT|nr:SusC/RagA family TonB-linked outer membrane protein [Chitinophaga sancti]WQD61856.1 SusC/RagA family TonB-linked outer membrane protein [Chitinophaga sancti]WQG92575.1 SusC/RagA family TonB-linked outer membrane protein [Chitinophaga sancti]SFW62676.1 TonB-linked outer membrane protein, SusC/RagA family [Chitinophaga sancti]